MSGAKEITFFVNIKNRSLVMKSTLEKNCSNLHRKKKIIFLFILEARGITNILVKSVKKLWALVVNCKLCNFCARKGSIVQIRIPCVIVVDVIYT